MLPTIFYKYELNQIYNAKEFGLFYRAQPDKSLHLKDENCVNSKHSKLHLTGLTAANAVREKLALFFIGKSKKPRCFKQKKHLPCSYIVTKADNSLVIIVQPTQLLMTMYQLN